MSEDNDFSFLTDDPVTAARRLLGCHLVREVNGIELVGKIVETEAYHQSDAASHSYKGRTQRTEVLFGPAAHAYVYFTYGMHYCMNVVTGPAGEGSAVLIRALEPVQGLAVMQQHRPNVEGVQLTNGPAKLCQALQIDQRFNGHDLAKPPLRLRVQPAVAAAAVTQTTRIGISRDVSRPWRFYLSDNSYVSKK